MIIFIFYRCIIMLLIKTTFFLFFIKFSLVINYYELLTLFVIDNN